MCPPRWGDEMQEEEEAIVWSVLESGRKQQAVSCVLGIREDMKSNV